MSAMIGILVESIERQAGHIMVCLLLLGIGAAFFKFNIPKGEDIIVFSLGVLARSMVSPSDSKIKS